jgi:hypothetical protein
MIIRTADFMSYRFKPTDTLYETVKNFLEFRETLDFKSQYVERTGTFRLTENGLELTPRSNRFTITVPVSDPAYPRLLKFLRRDTKWNLTPADNTIIGTEVMIECFRREPLKNKELEIRFFHLKGLDGDIHA